MSQSSSEDPPTEFRRSRGALYPTSTFSEALMHSIPEGGLIELRAVRRRRNYERLKAYWATLRDCVDATGCAPSIRALHNECKLSCGLVEAIQYKDGTIVMVPGSISFAKMSETDMIEYFEAAMAHLAEKFGYA